jgi:hypothetical protein
MFIRTTPTRNSSTGETYTTHRLVESRRVGGKVRQITLLNLGRHFPLSKERWPDLCSRINQLLGAQAPLMALVVPETVERLAQRYAAQLIVRSPQEPGATPGEAGAAAPTVAPPAFAEIEPDSLQLVQPRSVGVEHAALSAMQSVGFEPLLASLGINGVMRTSIIATIVARMAAPGSELASHRWLTGTSALGELLDVDLAGMPLSRLYRASDQLLGHRDAIESALFSRIEALFALETTVTLYDLTNTYFEGEVPGNAKAKQGRSKEKRSDCPLVTLGLVLDGSGFVRRSRTFAGNVFEGATLQGMLAGLGAPPGALVIMDAGIATEANLAWLVEQGYRYLVVRRGGARQFDDARAVAIETASGEPLRLQKEVGEEGKEVRLYCQSPGREAKETAMVTRFAQGFETGLQKIADGLNKPHGEKRHGKLLERIGRLKEKSRGASQHYTIKLEVDASGKKVTALAWEKSLVAGTMATHPGVYCLRSSETGWDEEKLWRTYTMLTDLEAVFRSLKGELGLRPIFHSKEARSDGHLFISVLAYQFVQIIRTRLKAQGIHTSWAGLREVLAVQRRVTATFVQRDGRTLHVRKTTQPEPDLKRLYEVLGVLLLPGGTKKLVV